ncbi:MAG: YfiR family protein [Melioribacteraceae bacterium]|nr:YfiR family protein [Melioribacteraceae bacterium]
MEKRFCSILLASITLMIFSSTANILAQGMDIPANLQAALFKKIFAFNNTLKSKGSAEVAVLTGSGSGGDVVAAFKDAGISVKEVSGSNVPGDVDVVYVMPGVASPKSQTAGKGVLSISGVGSYAEKGDVAIGIGVEGGKPKIIIHFAQLKAEGQEISADLLKIAKVIQ